METAKKRAIIFIVGFAFVLTIAFPLCLPGAMADESKKMTWEQVVAEARKEAEVLVYGNFELEKQLPLLEKAMKEHFGIRIKNVQLRGSEGISKIKAEHAGKNYRGDFFTTGSSLLPAVASYLENTGILPSLEESEGKWMTDPLQYKPAVLLWGTAAGIGINTKAIPPGSEPKTWKEIADPKWMGKFTMGNPGRPGPVNKLMTYLYSMYGEEWLRKVLIDNKPIMQRQLAQTTSMVIRGEYIMQVGALARTYSVELEKSRGVPIKWYYPEEGIQGGVILGGVLKNAPHPNAARVFLNYLLSKEAQISHAKAYHVILRNDISVMEDFQNSAKSKFLQPFPPSKKFDRKDSRSVMKLCKEILRK